MARGSKAVVGELLEQSTELRRVRWQFAELAVQYLVADKTATYRDAAELFGVGVHQLRARVLYRHGSLAEMRLSGSAEVDAPDLVRRNCMSCGVSVLQERNLRLCSACRAK